MSVIRFIQVLAAGSLPALIFGAPIPSNPSAEHVHSLQARDSYTVFGGNGAVSDGWPSMSDWVSTFDEMFDANKNILSSSCTQWNVPNNSDEEINDMSNSIQSVAKSTGVDPRFILAIVIQESNGCVRAPTTNYGVVNPGLMQSHDGTGSCNNGGVQTPCPASEITQMIKDGTAGTASGPGLQQLLQKTGVDDVSKYYLAARMYNSGSVASDGNLGQGVATHCYVSDVTNRLLGWSSGPSTCDANTVGDITKSTSPSGPAGGVSSAAPAPAPATTAAPPPAPATSAPATSAPAPTTTAPAPPAPPAPTTTAEPAPASTTAPAVTSAPPPAAPTTSAAPAPSSTTAPAAPPPPKPTSSAPIYPGAAKPCAKYYTVESGDYCLRVEAEVGISASQLAGWNSGLDASCSNLWLGYQYCIQA